jgi:hypothetical protein
VNYFDINEKLKEELVLNYQAIFAKTIFLSAGNLLLPEPFYETAVLWEKNTDIEILQKAYKLIVKHQKKLGEQMTDPIFEYSLQKPSMVWATFTQPLSDAKYIED